MFARLINGVINQVAPAIPHVWDNADGTSTSGFDTLSDKERLEHGEIWVEVVDARPEPGDGELLGGDRYEMRDGVPTLVADIEKAPPPAPAPSPLTPIERLAALGLTPADLKALVSIAGS